VEIERKIVAHIKELGKAGFAPDRRTGRSIAYRFAVELNFPRIFDKEKQMTGHDWLRPFMDRNSVLSVRQSQDLSDPRAQRMDRADLNNYFKFLQ
jgi:hypothetical protein